MKQLLKELGVVVGAVGLMGCLLISFSMMVSALEKDTIQLELERKSIQSCVLDTKQNLEVSGDFVLGIGSLNGSTYEDIKYYFYVMGQRGYKLSSVDADYVEIVETNDIEPCIEGYFTEYGELCDRISCAGKDKKMLRYTLYVPEGTLKQSYNLDLVTNN